MTRRHGLLAIFAALALLVPASTAGAGPAANKSGEELLTYLDTGKIKVSRQLSISFMCTVPTGGECLVTASAQFLTPGPNPPSEPSISATLPANTELFQTLRLRKQTRNILKNNVKKVKLRSQITVQNLTTGEIDTDSQVFRFKK